MAIKLILSCHIISNSYCVPVSRYTTDVFWLQEPSVASRNAPGASEGELLSNHLPGGGPPHLRPGSGGKHEAGRGAESRSPR